MPHARRSASTPHPHPRSPAPAGTQTAGRTPSLPPNLPVPPFPAAAGKWVERVALPYVFKFLVTELAAMNIRCSLDLK